MTIRFIDEQPAQPRIRFIDEQAPSTPADVTQPAEPSIQYQRLAPVDALRSHVSAQVESNAKATRRKAAISQLVGKYKSVGDKQMTDFVLGLDNPEYDDNDVKAFTNVKANELASKRAKTLTAPVARNDGASTPSPQPSVATGPVPSVDKPLVLESGFKQTVPMSTPEKQAELERRQGATVKPTNIGPLEVASMSAVRSALPSFAQPEITDVEQQAMQERPWASFAGTIAGGLIGLVPFLKGAKAAGTALKVAETLAPLQKALPTLGKYAPVLVEQLAGFAAHDQAFLPLDADWKTRAETAAKSAETAVLFTASGGANKYVQPIANAALGYGMAKESGESDQMAAANALVFAAMPYILKDRSKAVGSATDAAVKMGTPRKDAAQIAEQIVSGIEKSKETANAATKGKEQTGRVEQYPQTDSRGIPAETGGSDSVRLQQEAQKEVAQPISVQPTTTQQVGAIAPKIAESGPTISTQEKQNAPIQEVQAEGTVKLPVGPGAANAKEPTIVEGTALKNAVADIERIQTGIEPATPSEKMDFASKLTEGRAIIESDNGAGSRLVEDLVSGAPRPVTRTESGVLLAHKVTVANEMNAAAEAMQKANTPQEQADASNRFSKAQQEFQNILDASKSVGSEAGWTLAFRKLMVNDDFSLPTMISKARSNIGGKELPQERQSKIIEQAKQIERLDKKLAEIEQNKQNAGVDAVISEAQRSKDKLVSEAEKDASIKSLSEKPELESESIGSDIQKLARYFVEQGVTNRDDLVRAVHAEVVKVKPEFTERMTKDAISGYGKYSKLKKDEVSVILRDLKGQLQQVSKLEDMASGKAPSKTGVERRIPSDEERGLIKQVNEAKKAGGFEVTDPATQLRTALQAVKTRLQNQIKDLELQISTRQKIVRQKSPSPQDAESLALQKRRDELRAQFDEIFGRPEMTDAQRLAAWKTRTTNRIAELEKRIANQDFSKPERLELVHDQYSQELQYRLEQIKRKYQEDMVNDWLKNRTTTQKLFGRIGETINTARAIMTGGEFSAVLRQGGWFAFSHPIRTAKAIVPMFKAFASEQGQFRVEQEIRNRQNAPLYKKSGLYLNDSNGPLSRMEEATMNRWAQKIPFISGSQRAYNTFLNKLRADAFDAMVKSLSKTGTPTTEETKAIAHYINVATGRGSFGVHNENVAVGLNTFLFAPRYVASRFQLLGLDPVFRSSGRARKAIASEYARYLAGIGLTYSLAKLMGAEIEEDPRSSDFGKIKIGNTRIDPLSGLSQTTVFISRIASGETKTVGGEEIPLRSTYRPLNKIRDYSNPMQTKGVPYGKEMDTVLWRFLRQKFSPLVGTTVSLATGKGMNKVTEEDKDFTLIDVPQQTFIPITYQDVYSTMLEQGVPRGTAISLLAIFGMGVQNYTEKEKKAHSLSSLGIDLGIPSTKQLIGRPF